MVAAIDCPAVRLSQSESHAVNDTTVHLRPFLRHDLDLLFVGLNPPKQSNTNGHYFSGKQSRFFDLIYRSGLIIAPVSKNNADEIVFGGTTVNYQNKRYGVVDLIPEVVMTHSANVTPQRKHVDALLETIRNTQPRVVCIIHGTVAKAVVRYGALSGPLDYGLCGKIIGGSDALVALNYFPNGNSIPDAKKLAIFGSVRDLL